MALERRFLDAKALEKKKRMEVDEDTRARRENDLLSKAKNDLYFRKEMSSSYNTPEYQDMLKGEKLDKHMQNLIFTRAFFDAKDYKKHLQTVKSPEFRSLLEKKYLEHQLIDEAFKKAGNRDEVSDILGDPKLMNAIRNSSNRALKQELKRRYEQNEIKPTPYEAWTSKLSDLEYEEIAETRARLAAKKKAAEA